VSSNISFIVAVGFIINTYSYQNLDSLASVRTLESLSE